MDRALSTPPLLSEENVAFILRYTSISVAARDANNRPLIARASGIDVSPDRRQVIVYLCQTNAGPVLQGLRDNGMLALVATRPTTHAALQVKGRVSAIRATTDADRTAMEAYQLSFIAELGHIGYSAPLIRALLDSGDECVAVHFEPAQIFNQTPGPKAGENLARLQ